MSTKHLTLGGITTALTIVLLYLTLLIPTNTLTLLTLASFMVPISLIRSNVKTALLVYIASSLLSFLLLPLPVAMMYLLFFGSYGIIKYLIERFDHVFIEWIMKLLYFNIVFWSGYHLFATLVSPHALDKLKEVVALYLPAYPFMYSILFVIGVQVVFILFDYALTMLINWYYEKFH